MKLEGKKDKNGTRWHTRRVVEVRISSGEDGQQSSSSGFFSFEFEFSLFWVSPMKLPNAKNGGIWKWELVIWGANAEISWIRVSRFEHIRIRSTNGAPQRVGSGRSFLAQSKAD